MPSQITNYQCPACTGGLHFSSATGKLECEYCGSSYTVEEIEAFYAQKDEAAAQAQAKAEAKAEAQAQMFPAEQLFRAGNFEAALNGDGNTLGFTDIIDNYGKRAGKAANLYAGLCNLQLGNNEDAIAFLKKYSVKDKIMQARAYSAIGDAYSNLKDYTNALAWYKKAAALEDNEFRPAYLLKAALVMEETGDTAGALSLYKEIETKYPQTVEGYDIQKYISRIENQK